MEIIKADYIGFKTLRKIKSSGKVEQINSKYLFKAGQLFPARQKFV